MFQQRIDSGEKFLTGGKFTKKIWLVSIKKRPTNKRNGGECIGNIAPKGDGSKIVKCCYEVFFMI